MNVLIFGGTGAMGAHITSLLAAKDVAVTVTSRKERVNKKNISYVVGDAKNDEFLRQLCSKHWDAIIDFMVYTTEMLESRIDLLLDCTDQYVFISSARVYADNEGRIKEDSPRLLEVSKDDEYLNTNEYALEKAREENILFRSKKKNWTIVRPSLTYSEQRLQLGVYEKENWLYRALHGRSIVFSQDLMDKYYTLSYGLDVAEGIAALIGNAEAVGEIFHIVVDKEYQWKEILEVYLSTIEKMVGTRPKVVLTDFSTNLQIKKSRYQVIYGRYFNRRFDASKIQSFVDTSRWIDAKTGLEKCLIKFLEEPQFLDINWAVEGLIDRAAHEWTPLSEISGTKNKLVYIKYRMGIGLVGTSQ